uniref:FZ domain-containing protein n=1 Tax=Musca domestica TaxID=7370 RepID=A0A1I8MLG0_MUSDO
MERGNLTEADSGNCIGSQAAVATGNKVNQCMTTLAAQQQHEINLLSGRSLGLRRQPTKYPHGVAVCVQPISDGAHHHNHRSADYSRASTLRSSSWDGKVDGKCHLDGSKAQQQQQTHKCQMGGMFNRPVENLAELQVRRHKYPLTGNYYLDSPEAAAKTSLMTLQFGKRLCKWQYLRWPLIFAASVLVFFGLITYSIWLHDISVARERYLQQKKQSYDDDAMQSNGVANTQPTEGSTVRAAVTESAQVIRESTLLRTLSSRSRQRPREQKLSTVEYGHSKAANAWDKQRKDSPQDSTTIADETTTMISEAAAFVPANVFRFTSGHQNSFGVPIEEDERILRLIDGLFPGHAPSPTTTATVDSIAKVSPTIPPVTHNKPTAPMMSASSKPTNTQDSRCYSTSLAMCQGVLEYDLTYNISAHITPTDLKDYQLMVNSNCSARSAEFICAVFEPECRPSHIGILPPCRRICKAIREACSEIIANSDSLTETFDCSLYPDSSDPQRCDDPTRRKGYCYDNEFECYDSSCIPRQWQCDNIKDCPAGEDEDSCLTCDQPDEFRCRSNEKCVPDESRCDMKYDCFDGSDEENCSSQDNEDDSRFDADDINAFPRLFSYAAIFLPNQTSDSLYTYITTTTEDLNTPNPLQWQVANNRSLGVSKEDVTNAVPSERLKGFANFRDSKEIMMTSDSENNFEISATRGNRSTGTTPLQPAASILVAVSTEPPQEKVVAAVCAPHELRCVSGKCITVNQLCDRINDCPDGFDELMCVYKDRTTTARSRGTTILPNPFTTSVAINSTRSDKRTIRTTIKRKVKV